MPRFRRDKSHKNYLSSKCDTKLDARMAPNGEEARGMLIRGELFEVVVNFNLVYYGRRVAASISVMRLC